MPSHWEQARELLRSAGQGGATDERRQIVVLTALAHAVLALGDDLSGLSGDLGRIASAIENR